jgi:hypothetical protein
LSQAAHGYAVGDIIRQSAASTTSKAQADSTVNAEALGMVVAVADANTYTLQTHGFVSGLSGLVANSVYFLDPSTAGALTLTEPSTGGQVTKPMLITDTTTSGYILHYRGQLI